MFLTFDPFLFGTCFYPPCCPARNLTQRPRLLLKNTLRLQDGSGMNILCALRPWSFSCPAQSQFQSIPGLGYMSRTTIHSRRQPFCDTDLDDPEEARTEEDATVCYVSAQHESLTSRQYVVYSASFQVPAFYFTIHDSSTLCAVPSLPLYSGGLYRWKSASVVGSTRSVSISAIRFPRN